MSKMILQVRDVVREYQLPRPSFLSKPGSLRVLHGVNVEIEAGQSLGIVGESGSGKSTLARAVMGLERPQSGQILINGQDIYALDRSGLREARKGFQAIFQDPYGSLDPRHTVKRIISEPIVSLERGQAARSGMSAWQKCWKLSASQKHLPKNIRMSFPEGNASVSLLLAP